jgi:hypothetical protein
MFRILRKQEADRGGSRVVREDYQNREYQD